MKRHIMIALTVVVAIVLPLAAATKGAKRASTSAAPAVETATTAGAEDKPAIPRKPAATAAKKKPATATAGERPARVPAKQNRARQLVADLTESQQSKLLTFLNEASLKELENIQGISTVRGSAIEKARPYNGIDEVILVSGVGEGTFGEIVKHGKTLALSQASGNGSKKSATTRKAS